jgi:uncharacterized membrane protein
MASLGAGLCAAAVLLAVFVAAGEGDALGTVSLLIRFAHVLAAAVWVGLIVFVNCVLLAALEGADEGGRAHLVRLLVPGVSAWLRHAATATVVAGALLLLTTGYLFPALVYGSGVYMPFARQALLWAGIIGALVMLGLLHMYIAPATEILLGRRSGDAGAKARARAQIAGFARVNLIIVVPVLLAMLAVAHLY